MPLRHIHLPSNPTRASYPSYALAATIQEHLRRSLLSAKDHPSAAALPLPTLLTFTPTPTYTYGRRQTALDPSEGAILTAPLKITSATGRAKHFTPTVLASPRGGLTTYHGPGQVVLWPVLDIASHARPAPLTVRSYARTLEDTTIALLRRRFGLEAFTTSDPGVWVASRPDRSGQEGRGHDGGAQTRKIAAMGVHLRRHVSALGVALNLDMPTTRGRPEGDDVESNPWARFVACGLDGKGVTCVREEVGPAAWTGGRLLGTGEDVAGAWAAEFAERAGLGGVERVDEDDVARLVEEGERKLLEGMPRE